MKFLKSTSMGSILDHSLLSQSQTQLFTLTCFIQVLRKQMRFKGESNGYDEGTQVLVLVLPQ